MTDKRFLKVKRLGEERYFTSQAELERFCEKQEGVTIMDALHSDILIRNNYEYIRMHFPNFMPDNREKQDMFVSGGFMFNIYYGYFYRMPGVYDTINILAIQKESRLSMNDLRRLIFGEQYPLLAERLNRQRI
jgi:hypothetical protein